MYQNPTKYGSIVIYIYILYIHAYIYIYIRSCRIYIVGTTFVARLVSTSRELTSDSKAHAWWTSESGVLDAVVLVGPTPSSVSRTGFVGQSGAPSHEVRNMNLIQRRAGICPASLFGLFGPYEKFEIAIPWWLENRDIPLWRVFARSGGVSKGGPCTHADARTFLRL